MYKAIITKYLPATNHKGGRIKAGDEDGNTATTSYPYEASGEDVLYYHSSTMAAHRRAADALCAKMGWDNNLVGGSLKRGYAFVFVS